jgi:hypothetical protein
VVARRCSFRVVKVVGGTRMARVLVVRSTSVASWRILAYPEGQKFILGGGDDVCGAVTGDAHMEAEGRRSEMKMFGFVIEVKMVFLVGEFNNKFFNFSESLYSMRPKFQF